MSELLKEAMQLELNMRDLYVLYNKIFQEDKDFWLQLAKEESHHAALLDLSEDFPKEFPKEIIYNNLPELKKVNKIITDAIAKFKNESPPKQEAYKLAYDLENGAYELHFQQMAQGESKSKVMQRFQQLNADDKDHAERIKKLL